MRSFNASNFIGFIVTMITLETNLRAETNWLTWVNDVAQNYVALVESAESVSIDSAKSSSRFTNTQWQSTEESEKRLNHLVEKLISEEYTPYDHDTCIEQELATQSYETVKNKFTSKLNRWAGQLGIMNLPFECLHFTNDSLEQLDIKYRSLINRSSKIDLHLIHASIEVAHELIRLKATKEELLVKTTTESFDCPTDTKLAKIFGMSVLPDFDLIAPSTSAESATALWEEVRNLAIVPYSVPSPSEIEFTAPQGESRETRISKGSFESVR